MTRPPSSNRAPGLEGGQPDPAEPALACTRAVRFFHISPLYMRHSYERQQMPVRNATAPSSALAGPHRDGLALHQREERGAERVALPVRPPRLLREDDELAHEDGDLAPSIYLSLWGPAWSGVGEGRDHEP